MKIREQINSNAEPFAATAYEHERKIIVFKRDTSNYYDRSTDECFVFDTVRQYESWKAEQDWIIHRKTRKVSAFRNVANDPQ